MSSFLGIFFNMFLFFGLLVPATEVASTSYLKLFLVQVQYLSAMGDALASKSELLSANASSWSEFFTGSLSKVNPGKGVRVPLLV